MRKKAPKKLPPGVYATPEAGRVRCLGPNEPDHWFGNDGTLGNRVCGWCRGEQVRLNLSVLAAEPVPIASGVQIPSE